MNLHRPSEAAGRPSRLPHRLAWMLACAAFLLVGLGGLVTTHDAGMAVPDWPTTYGHWLYPPGEWLRAGRDLFLKNGHRMAAMLVGLLAVALCAALWWKDRRRSVRGLGCAIAAAVAVQATLGGLRVLLDRQVLALIHASIAPLVFALSAAAVTVTSTRWREPVAPGGRAAGRRVVRLAAATASALYAQVVLGALLRHPGWDAAVRWFEALVWLKVVGAALVVVGAGWLLVATRGDRVERPAAIRLARLLAALVLAQIALAGPTWVVHYGLPGWFRNHVWTMDYTVVQYGAWQVAITTTHAVIGALALATASCLVLWLAREGPEPCAAATPDHG